MINYIFYIVECYTVDNNSNNGNNSFGM